MRVQRLLYIILALVIFIFMPGRGFAGNADLSSEYPFNVEIVTSDADTTFYIAIAARGNFVIDWGDDGDGDNPRVLSFSPTDASTVIYSHKYANAGRYIVKVGGLATQYNNSSSISTITFYTAAEQSANVDTELSDESDTDMVNNAQLLVGIYGRIGAIFPTLSESQTPNFLNLFYNASNIVTSIPPHLFDGVTGTRVGIFNQTFAECSGLTGRIPETLFATLDSGSKYGLFESTFSGCSGLTGNIPANLFGGISGGPASRMFVATFAGCSGLTGTIPENLFSGISGAPGEAVFSKTFAGASGLTGQIPEKLFAGVKGDAKISLFSRTFDGCTSLSGPIPQNLFKNITGTAGFAFYYTFANCSGLTGPIPEKLFSGISGNTGSCMFYGTFYNCSGLSGPIPENLFSGISGDVAGKYMFYSTFTNCSNLTGYVPYGLLRNIDSIGTDSISAAFRNMFTGATSMDTVCPSGTITLVPPAGNWGNVAFCRFDCPMGYHGDGGTTNVSQCRIACPGGTYIATANSSECLPVGPDYWNGENYTNWGNVGTRNACPPGLHTTGYGRGADDAGDCGAILHFGPDKQLQLRSLRRTTPSLNVLLNGHHLYGDTAPGRRVGHLCIKLGDQVYNVYNPDMEE